MEHDVVEQEVTTECKTRNWPRCNKCEDFKIRGHCLTCMNQRLNKLETILNNMLDYHPDSKYAAKLREEFYARTTE